MFKPNEQARVRSDGRIVTIKMVLPRNRVLCSFKGQDAVIGEDELQMAMPPYHYVRERKPPPKIDYDLRDKVADQLRSANLPVSFRGHWKDGAHLGELKGQMWRHMTLMGSDLSEDSLRELSEALTTGRATAWTYIGKCMTTLCIKCTYCAQGSFDLETNGVEARLVGGDCPFPDGFEHPNEWELNVPSGKIVVANNLREWFPLPEGDDDIPSIETILGRRMMSQAYAAVGLSYASVGNTCPGVYKLKDGSFKIAKEPPSEYWDGKTWAPCEQDFEGERVAGICTDLWWYSLCDLDEFNRRVEKFGGSIKSAGATVIDVKPGVYRFQHDDEVCSADEGPKERLFTAFEWVRPADPVKDFLKEHMVVEVNPHAYVQAQAQRWPTVYGAVRDEAREDAIPWDEMTDEQRHHAWYRVADSIFCVIGSGTDWHEKGFPQSKVDPKVEDIEPPSFRAQYPWYPFAKPYGGLFEPKTMTPSFAKVAFRVLESVISFGTTVREGPHSRNVFETRGRMLLAVKRYRELAKEYPDQADPEYVWWLSQKGRAEKWIRNFDLGPVFTDKHREHAKSQRWVPEDAYAVEFDARKLKVKDGHFAGKYGWESQKTAPNYALMEWSDNKLPPEQNCFWAHHALRTAVPVYSVARVVKVGEVSHRGETLVEIAYDYGTPWMKDPKKRKAIREHEERDGIRVLTKGEYELLLAKITKE